MRPVDVTDVGEVDVDHHTSWFSFLPGYQNLLDFLNGHHTSHIVLPIGSHHYHGVHHVFGAFFVVLLLVFGTFIARRQLMDIDKAIIPSKKLTVGLFFELLIEQVIGMMRSVLGDEYKRYVPVIGTCALFILCSNLLGLVPGFVPPTDNLNTTLAAAIVVFVWFNFHGFRQGGIHHVTHMLNPLGTWWGWFLTPLLGIVEVFGVLLRPVTLALRLAANMIGDHAVLFAFAGIFPLLVPLPFYVLGLLVCLIQTAVFCILSTVYIALHTPDEAHH